METILSPDGTTISYSRSGSGPPLVLVHGSVADRTRWTSLLPELEQRFTVIAMDRRGRGGSGDSEDYVLAREYEDVAAVVQAAGPGASLLGHSFGALCAMEAALQLDHLSRLILYEPPFPVGGASLYPPGQRERLHAVFAEGDREAFLIYFFREIVGVTEDQIAAMRADPSWKGRVAAAHTALRELGDGDYRFEPNRFRQLDTPTLLLVGENSPAELTAPTRELDNALPNSRVIVLKGQGHVAMTTAPELFLRKVVGFLSP